MKPKLIQLTKRYGAALRTHLQPGSGASLQPALALGRQAVALRLDPLDLARMHEQAAVALDGNQAMRTRAQHFFTEALAPLVATQRAARESRSDLNRLNRRLVRCTADLGACKRRLQQSIVRRQTVEATLEKTGANYARLLQDSIQLQAGFRQLTRQVLAAQEDERKKISGELQNEIAQTLVGINLRLLSLKQQSVRNTRGLQAEIANTKRLVVRSVKSVKGVATRFARA
jgi:signal transduction histidine kinase